MVPRQQVIDYISSNLRSGYDVSTIRSKLISSGYGPAEVNAAIDIIKSGSPTASSNHSNVSTYSLLGFAMIGLLVVAVVTMVLFNNPQDTLPRAPSNTGSSFEEPTRTPPSQSPDTSTVKNSGDSKSSTTRTNTELSGTKSETPSSTPTRTIPAVDYTPTTNTQLTTRLVIESKVSELAASRPDEAATLCSQITTLAGRHSCYNNVAQASEESRFCLKIDDDESADSCLTSLAIRQVEDVNLCTQIKGEIRFRQCVVLYDSKAQLQIIEQASSQVSVQPMAVPEYTPEEIADAAIVDLMDEETTEDQNTPQNQELVQEKAPAEQLTDLEDGTQQAQDPLEEVPPTSLDSQELCSIDDPDCVTP